MADQRAPYAFAPYLAVATAGCAVVSAWWNAPEQNELELSLNTPFETVANVSNEWFTEVIEEESTASKATLAVSIAVLAFMIVMMVIMWILAALCALRELRGCVHGLRTWNIIVRLGLVLFSFLVAWKVVEPRTDSDRFFLVVLLLLLAWRLLSYRIGAGHRQVWAKTKQHIRNFAGRVWILIPWLLLGISLLLALWVVKKLAVAFWAWVEKTPQIELCRPDDCDTTTYLVPFLLLLAFIMAKKLWAHFRQHRLLDFAICVALVVAAALLFLTIWWTAFWNPCNLIRYFALVMVLLAFWLMRKLMIQAPHRNVRNNLICAMIISSIVSGLWIMKTVQKQAYCCGECDLEGYPVALLIFSVSWAVKQFLMRATRSRISKITTCFALATVLLLALWTLQTDWTHTSCCNVCENKNYATLPLLFLALWIVRTLWHWIPRGSPWQLFRYAVMKILVVGIPVWASRRLQLWALPCCVLEQTLQLSLILSGLLAPWPSAEASMQNHLVSIGCFVMRIITVPVRVNTLLSTYDAHRRIQFMVSNFVAPWHALGLNLRFQFVRLVSFVERIILIPVYLVTSPSTQQLENQIQPTGQGPLAPQNGVSAWKLLSQSYRASDEEKSRHQKEKNELEQSKTGAETESQQQKRRYNELVSLVRSTYDPEVRYADMDIRWTVKHARERMEDRERYLREKIKDLSGLGDVQAAAEAREQAEEAISGLKRELQNLKSTHENQVKDSKSELAEKSGDLDQLRKEKINADTLSQNYASDLQKKHDGLQLERQQRVEGLETELQQLQTKHNDARIEQQRQADDLEAKLQQQAKIIANFEAATAEEERLRKAAELDLAELREAASEQENSIGKQDKTFMELRDAATKQEGAVKELQRTAADNRRKISELESNIGNLQQQLVAATEKQEIVDKLNERMETETAEGRSASDRSSEAYAAELANKDRELELLRERIGMLEENASNHQELPYNNIGLGDPATSILQSQFESLSQQLDAARSRAFELGQSNSQLLRDNKELNDKLADAEAMYWKLESNAYGRVGDLESDLAKAKETVVYLQGTISTGNMKMVDLDHKLRVSEQELGSLHQKLREVQVSRTKPTVPEEDVVANLSRAKVLLDEISVVGCKANSSAQYILSDLLIANSTLVKVYNALIDTSKEEQTEQFWTGIRKDLVIGIIKNDDLENLHTANKRKQDRGGEPHQSLLKQAQASSKMINTLLIIVTWNVTSSRSNDMLEVMRGRDEEDDDQGPSEPESGPSKDVGGNTASKERRNDDGPHLAPSGSSEPSTKGVSSYAPSVPMTTMIGQHPTPSVASAPKFTLEQNHAFNMTFGFPSSNTADQRPPPGQRIFNLSTEDTGDAAQLAPLFPSESPNIGDFVDYNGSNEGRKVFEGEPALVTPASPVSDDGVELSQANEEFADSAADSAVKFGLDSTDPEFGFSPDEQCGQYFESLTDEEYNAEVDKGYKDRVAQGSHPAVTNDVGQIGTSDGNAPGRMPDSEHDDIFGNNAPGGAFSQFAPRTPSYPAQSRKRTRIED